MNPYNNRVEGNIYYLSFTKHNFIIIYGVFKANQDCAKNAAIATGIPASCIARYTSEPIIGGIMPSGHNRVDFYINTNGSLCCVDALTNGLWYECCGIYLGMPII
jgi:hypothetical protein